MAIAERISLLLGAGIAVQNRATAFPANLSPLAITIEPIIETALSPSCALGMEIELGHATPLSALVTTCAAGS